MPLDVVRAGCMLLSPQLSVHAVDGIQPGLYHGAGDALRAHRHLAAVEARVIAAHLCLDQGLGEDSAYTVFVRTGWRRSSKPSGDRGYRVARAEAGIVVERLQLVAFTLGDGATGLTFYDDEVAAFGTDTPCLMAGSVGVPDTGRCPADRPGDRRG